MLIADIVRTMPQFNDVLELYYHCKICSAPQAYLEQESFLQHVQEAHPEQIMAEHDDQIDTSMLPTDSKSTQVWT